MSKSTPHAEPDATAATEDFSELELDQQFSIVSATVEALCVNLESQGLDTEVITAVLLESFAQRMASINDRAGYEEMLTEALDTEWQDQSIH